MLIHISYADEALIVLTPNPQNEIPIDAVSPAKLLTAIIAPQPSAPMQVSHPPHSSSKFVSYAATTPRM